MSVHPRVVRRVRLVEPDNLRVDSLEDLPMTASQFQKSNSLENKIRDAIRDKDPLSLALGWLRYEAVRKLNVREQKELRKRTFEGANYDALIDELVLKSVKIMTIPQPIHPEAVKAAEEIAGVDSHFINAITTNSVTIACEIISRHLQPLYDHIVELEKDKAMLDFCLKRRLIMLEDCSREVIAAAMNQEKGKK